MASSFEDGIECAAREIEQEDCGLVGRELLDRLAAKVRSLRAPANGSNVTIISGIDAAFERFKEAYPAGPRNHWTPARKAFEAAVKKRKHSPEVIIQGAIAFSRSGKRREFIEAPAVFLNQDRFLTEYEPARPDMMGSAGLFAISDHFGRN